MFRLIVFGSIPLIDCFFFSLAAFFANFNFEKTDMAIKCGKIETECASV